MRSKVYIKNIYIYILFSKRRTDLIQRALGTEASGASTKKLSVISGLYNTMRSKTCVNSLESVDIVLVECVERVCPISKFRCCSRLF